MLAPHPDDETVGLGGTLALHGRAGDSVHVIFVTTGIHGDPGSTHSPEEYVGMRQAEARNAAEVLGLAETVFWEFPDSCVVTSQDMEHVVSRLKSEYERIRPDVVYAPHIQETHSDHHFIGLAARETHREVGRGVPLLGYEVWSPLVPTLLVDVTSVYEASAHRPNSSPRDDVEGARREDARPTPDSPPRQHHSLVDRIRDGHPSR